MFRPNRTGLVTCRAVNRENSTTTSASVILSDLDEDLLIWTNNESPIAIGDEVFLSCGASAHKYSGGIEWFKDENVIENSEGVKMFTYFSFYSLQWLFHSFPKFLSRRFHNASHRNQQY